MRDVVDDPRMSGLTAFDWLERCRYKESTRETWEMGGSEANRREVNPLRMRLECRLEIGMPQMVLARSYRRRERINDSTSSNESASTWLGLEFADGSERAGFQEIDLKRRVKSEIVC